MADDSIFTVGGRVAFWTIIFWIGVGLFLSGIGTFAYQCLTWLRFGYWPQFEFSLALDQIGLGDLSTDWVGVNRIIRGIMEQPMAVGLLAFGCVIGGLGIGRMSAAQEAEKEERRKAKQLKSKSPSME